MNILESKTTLPPILSTWPPKFLKVALALGSGLLMGLTVSPINAWYLGWVAIVPLWILVVHPQHLRSGAVLYGLCWGIGYHGWALSWILGVHPMTWMGVPWLTSLAIAIACLVLITLWGAAVVTLWALGLSWIGRYIKLPPLIRVLTGTALWCGIEYLWSQSDLWWSTLALTQSPYNLPILHLGQLSGGSTVTAMLVAVNGLIAEAILVNWKTQRRSAISLASAAAILLFSGHLIGAVLAQAPTSAATALQVGIIQGNIPNEIKLYADGRQQAMTNYTQGYRKLVAEKVQVVLTPEGSLPLLPESIKQSELYEAILEQGIPIWLGAFGDAGKNYTNSLHSIDGQGNFGGRYNKYKLVPLGEYVPFKEVIGKLIKRMSPLQADQLKGAKNQIFETPFGRAIVGICYESAFGEHFRWQAKQGGEFIITASNNAHYAAAMPAQHHAQDVMRSIETSRWAVRATNTGYSAIVDPHGHTLWQSALHEFVTHSHKIYRLRTQTLYVQLGDWLTPTLLIVTMVLLGASYFRYI